MGSELLCGLVWAWVPKGELRWGFGRREGKREQVAGAAEFQWARRTRMATATTVNKIDPSAANPIRSLQVTSQTQRLIERGLGRKIRGSRRRGNTSFLVIDFDKTGHQRTRDAGVIWKC